MTDTERALRELVAGLDARSNPPQSKPIGRPRTVHHVVRRIVQLRKQRLDWERLTETVNAEGGYDYSMETLQTYFKRRHKYLARTS
jgi:hypothetical protein